MVYFNSIIFIDSEAPFSSVSNITWRQGRQLLRQYLQEIGYAETIIDVRSNRVRSLLGLNNNTEQQDDGAGGQGVGQNTGGGVTGTGSINGNGNETHKRAGDNQGDRLKWNLGPGLFFIRSLHVVLVLLCFNVQFGLICTNVIESSYLTVVIRTPT